MPDCGDVEFRPSIIKPTLKPSKKLIDSQASIKSGRSKILSSCRICLSDIFKPAVLTCGHRFCEGCLGRYWRLKEKPDYIVCPLCRACAFNVDFIKEETESSEDFRKTFNFNPAVLADHSAKDAILLCLKLSAVMPVLYVVWKWLKPFIALIIMFLTSMIS